MSLFTDTRDHIAHQLELAAGIISHFGLATGAMYEPYPGYSNDQFRHPIDDDSPISVSPLGALLLASNSTWQGYLIPAAWENVSDEIWGRIYPNVVVFARYLVGAGHAEQASPAATINHWATGRDEDEIVTTLKNAAVMALGAGPTDPMWVTP